MKDQRALGERRGHGSRVCHICQLALVEDMRCGRMVADFRSLLSEPTVFSRLIFTAMGIIFKRELLVKKDHRTSAKRGRLQSRLMVEKLRLVSPALEA